MQTPSRRTHRPLVIGYRRDLVEPAWAEPPGRRRNYSIPKVSRPGQTIYILITVVHRTLYTTYRVPDQSAAVTRSRWCSLQSLSFVACARASDCAAPEIFCTDCMALELDGQLVPPPEAPPHTQSTPHQDMLPTGQRACVRWVGMSLPQTPPSSCW
jgi:hypothetical protein